MSVEIPAAGDTIVRDVEASSSGNAYALTEAERSRLTEAGWEVVSSNWIPARPSDDDLRLLGRDWAEAAAGGRLSIVYTFSGRQPSFPNLRKAAQRHGGMDLVRALARRLSDDAPIEFLAPNERCLGYLVAAGRLGSVTEEAKATLAALPARVRLEVELADGPLLAALIGAGNEEAEETTLLGQIRDSVPPADGAAQD